MISSQSKSVTSVVEQRWLGGTKGVRSQMQSNQIDDAFSWARRNIVNPAFGYC